MDLQAFAAWKLALSSGNSALAQRLLNTLVEGEDGLIRRCAKRVARGGDLDDLVQAGRIGVLRAIQKYDPARGAWTGYAKQWIKEEMRNSIVAMYQAGDTPRWSRGMPPAVRANAQRILALTGKAATAEQLGVSEEDFARYTRKGGPSKQYDEDKSATAPRSEPCNFVSQASTEQATQAPCVLTDAFWRALASLTEQEARVFVDIVLHEKQVKEVAKAEGYEERWGTATYRRALAKMREAMVVRP